MMTLDHIGQQHAADKSSLFHCYLNTYEKYFSHVRRTADRILEIGVDGGASLRTWRDYFEKAEVFGVDHNRKCLDILDLGPRVKVIIGDAMAPAFWKEFVDKYGADFDIIIDDGAHTNAAIDAAFRLAWPLIRPGGLYIVEDLHAPYQPEYGGAGVIGGPVPASTKGAFAILFGAVHMMNSYGNPMCGDPRRANSGFAFVHFYRSLCIIGKR